MKTVTSAELRSKLIGLFAILDVPALEKRAIAIGPVNGSIELYIGFNSGLEFAAKMLEESETETS